MLTRWSDLGLSDLDNTFAVLNDLRREMNRTYRDAGRKQAGGPHMELMDKGAALMLRVQVPGIDEKDISITMENNSLAIKGERKDDVPEGYAVHRKERGAFTFSRALTLPCTIDAEKTTAFLKNGILELTLPKSPEAQPHQIQIQAN